MKPVSTVLPRCLMSRKAVNVPPFLKVVFYLVGIISDFRNSGRRICPSTVLLTPCFYDIFLVTVRWVNVMDVQIRENGLVLGEFGPVAG